MTFTLSAKSIEKMQGIHPDLVAVVRKAAEVSKVEFIVTEGLRTVERQKQLYKAGATKTMNSRHLTGHAVDLAAVVDGEVRWDWPLYDKIADAMLYAAGLLGHAVVWGGSWASFKDGPHFELNRNFYPAKGDFHGA